MAIRNLFAFLVLAPFVSASVGLANVNPPPQVNQEFITRVLAAKYELLQIANNANENDPNFKRMGKYALGWLGAGYASNRMFRLSDFNHITDPVLRVAEAQKRMYATGRGWIGNGLSIASLVFLVLTVREGWRLWKYENPQKIIADNAELAKLITMDDNSLAALVRLNPAKGNKILKALSYFRK